ncbi:MAG: NAD(P)-dependent alcohol dehydrogenase [Elusimicrobiota bacterium]
MKAARLHNYKSPLSLDEVPTPVPEPGQVVVKVAGAGFCHSDLHIIDGEIDLPLPLPLTLGHENAGYVAAVGRGVTTVREGDAVIVYGGWGCGTCGPCVTGHEQLCDNPQWAGLSKWNGGYAESILVPQERYLVKLSKLDPRRAAPLADAALTPYRAIKKALPFFEPDYKVLVIGLGGLGEYGLKLLRLFCGCKIIAVDTSDEKLKLARREGAAYALNGRDSKLAEKVLELTGGKGVCASFDFVGTDQTLATAISTTRAMGKVTQVGLAGGAANLKVLANSRFEVTFEATLWGTLKELREVVALAETGRLSLEETEFAPLDRINDVCARLKRGGVTGRLVMTP